MVHRLGMLAGVIAESFVEPEDAVVSRVQRIRREERLVFGIEQEHQTEHDAQHALIDVVAFRFEGRAQPVEAFARNVTPGRVLEAREQSLNGIEDLPSELLRHVRLALAARREQAFESVLLCGAVRASRMQQQLERRQDLATVALGHVGHAKA